MKKVTIKIRNPVAEKLREDSRFYQKIVKNKKAYDRNKMKKEIEDG